jgi:hypothetical protein
VTNPSLLAIVLAFASLLLVIGAAAGAIPLWAPLALLIFAVLVKWCSPERPH